MLDPAVSARSSGSRARARGAARARRVQRPGRHPDAAHGAGHRAGDEVIVPSYTSFATAGAVSRPAGTPVFADPCVDTLNSTRLRSHV
ncbi:MAG: DegT/DnrJ/EryC1/StrS family aminotransferase [Sandaracinaceae bacterium]|nr:DegT/DnrJ/EryC1/StrS family aminotransferase [Sandaracinaceae bacterium]